MEVVLDYGDQRDQREEERAEELETQREPTMRELRVVARALVGVEARVQHGGETRRGSERPDAHEARHAFREVAEHRTLRHTRQALQLA